LGGVSDPRDAIGYGVPQYEEQQPYQEKLVPWRWSMWEKPYEEVAYIPPYQEPAYQEVKPPDLAWMRSNVAASGLGISDPRDAIGYGGVPRYAGGGISDPRDAPGYVGPPKYGGGVGKVAVNNTPPIGGGAQTKPPASPTSPQRPANYGAPGRGGYGYPSYGGGGYGGGYTGGARVSNGGVEPEGKWYEGLVNWRF
jgi:hypothetical protein